jgi:Rad52/22 family double-strand break repair protein
VFGPHPGDGGLAVSRLPRFNHEGDFPMANQSEQLKEAVTYTNSLNEDGVRGYPRSIKDIITDLSKPVAARHIKTRKQGGSEIHYLEWHTAVKYLDLFACGWSYAVKSVALVGNLVTVIASISIPCSEGIVTREATGCEDSDAKGYGDPCSNAEAMALKRAASKFGLGISLYSK